MEEKLSASELREAVLKVFELRRVYEAAKKCSNDTYEKFQKESLKLAATLENLELDKFHTSAGTFSYGYEESYRVPKTEEQKRAFFTYLKQKGIYDQMVSVNSQALNSFAKAEEKAALEEGILDFQIPGLEKGAPTIKAIMRKK